ncbi:MAG: ferrochelatase [Bacteroidota bacterium]
MENQNNKTGVLLINLGTPDSPSTSDVRKYLFDFLNDGRVIDINPIARALLVNLIIVPFRAPKSAKLYKEIWSEKGSPLLYHGKNLTYKLRESLGADYEVYFAMRYQNPNMRLVLDEMKNKYFKKLIVLPLYPQYAGSTTGSTIELLMKEIGKWQVMPQIKIITKFYQNPDYISCVAKSSEKYNWKDYDHVLFSFHGIPERQIKRTDFTDCCLKENCCGKITAANEYCYKAGCYETARNVAKEIGIPLEKYSVSFQSRLGRDPWIKPYSDKVIEEFANKGMKKLLVFSPAFVADCLETIHEIGAEYDELFKEHGGEKIQLVESLNSNDYWVETVKKMILEN